jgi:predicted ATPase
MIVTVRSHGFRFDAPVVEDARAEGTAREPAGTFIGREAQLAATGALLEQVLAGRAAFAWVTGVAGIGKTRLVAELAARARARNVDVHVASCHETPVQPAFRPWTTAFESIARGGEADAALVEPAALALVDRGVDIGAFEQVAQALVALGRARPRLLTFDDLQWADEGSLELLRFVVREARDAPVLFVGTFRDTARPEDERARASGRLFAEYGGVHVPLRGLSQDETERLIHGLTSVEPVEAFRDEVYERSGGCPMFIRQLIETDWAKKAVHDKTHAMATSMLDLRRSLIETGSRHLEGLSPASRDVLAWAAVLGKSFSFALLAEVTALAAGALLDLVEEAERAHLVRRLEDGEYRFVHPVVADVLYKGLSASERAARHRAAAVALEAHHRAALDLHAAVIARHFVRAAPTGTAREAFEYSSRAARYAVRHGEGPSAAKHWAHAMRALDLLPGNEAARLDVLVELARVHLGAKDSERARSALLDAALLAQALGQADALAEVTRELANLVTGDEPTPSG